ncbi:MAG: polysaccharide lyase family protein [Tepidisphaeraceae bacterium]|jgi:rhamnogalacturonan endolyase
MNKTLHVAWVVCLVAGVVAGPARAADVTAAPVTLTEDAQFYTLANGILVAKIDKRSADLASLNYHGLEMLQSGEGRTNGYWSLPGTTMNFGSRHVASIHANPADNGGDRATVGVQFTYDGADGTAPADVEMVYSLARGDSAIYLQANWNHKPAYPALTFPVGRFAAKLNTDLFDYLATDAQRRRIMPTATDWGKGIAQNMKEARLLTTGQFKGQVEHKYDYAAVQYTTPAYGWAGTKSHVGVWMVTPSNEYMSGGPTKVELNAHLDGNEDGYPTLLNVWKGPHYGGTQIYVAPGESWVKSIGPFMLYCNSGDTGDAMWTDANARAARDAKAWPYDWVNEPAYYTPREQRAQVSGTIVLKDPVVQQSQISNLMVGLAAPDWAMGGAGGGGRLVDWQQDGKFYQFWVKANDDGSFTIPNVRAGHYTMHVFANGVLGEMTKTDITVEAGKPLDLGQLTWTPVRYGQQVWEIGTPDRTAGEFFHGDHFWTWGIYNQYPKDFPKDVNFVIGKSDVHKDWNLMQVPRGRDNTGRSFGTATTWTVSFQMPSPPAGRATLRLAFAGTEARALAVGVNGKLAGTVTNMPNTMVIHRDSDRGYWFERDVAFDATMMKAGDNKLTLTVPAGPVTAGVEYDYLRLELDPTGKPPAPGQNVTPGLVPLPGGNEGD